MATETIQPDSPDQKKITFTKGGLHQSLGVDPSQKIPSSMISAALAGTYGAKAKYQALFMKNVLKK